MKRITRFLLLLAVVIATVIRLIPGDYHIIFPYDQARDALYMRELVISRHLPLLGPISDIPGVHHGALYYYLLAPLYFLGKGDVRIVVWFFALVGSLTIIPLYILTKRLFSERSAFIAVLLFICSFEAISYSRWISNPVLAIPLFPIFLLLFEPFWRKRVGSALFLGIMLGVLIQLELVLGYLFFAVLFCFFRASQKAKRYLSLMVGMGIGALPILISELKFHFQALRGLLQFGSATTSKVNPLASQIFADVFNQAAMLIRNNLFGVTTSMALFIFIVIIFVLLRPAKFITEKQRGSVMMLVYILLCSILLFVVGKTVTNFFLVGLGTIFIMLVAFALDILSKKSRLLATLVLMLIMGSQLKLYAAQTQAHEAYVQVQPGVLLSDRLEVLDAIFAHIGANTPFSLSVFGTPYGVRTAWSYYFWWYAQHHGTPMPNWYGFVATGYVGDELLPHSDKPLATQITVYEPDFDVAGSARADFDKYQDEHTILVSQTEVNHHIIQFRVPKNL